MKIKIVSDNQETLDLWRESFPPFSGIHFVDSGVYRRGVDIVVLSGMWGFDRYGGSPSRESAQILPNELNDGMPDWVVIPPFLPADETGGDSNPMSPAYYAVLKSLLKITQDFGFCLNLALDLALLGMDDPEDVSTPLSVARAIERFLVI